MGRSMLVQSTLALMISVLLFSATEGISGGAPEARQGSVAGSAPVRGLLVRSTYPKALVSILTLDGKSLAVPARVREFPLGLSPDARLVAGVSAPPQLHGTGAVLLGPVHGGSMKTVLRGDCTSPPCPRGADPSYAWSPDAQRLAAAVNPARGPTLLKLLDRSGTVMRSVSLPRQSTERGDRAYHRLVSWSPNGRRLLLMRSNDYGPTAAVEVDVATGRSRTLAKFRPCDGPSLAWSPDSRLVALTSSGTQDCDDRFAIIDAASARPVLERSYPKGLGEGGTLWATDSRSVFAAAITLSATKPNGIRSRIDRVLLDGRRSNVIEPRAGWLIPRVALDTGLVYQTSPRTGYGALYLHRLSSVEHDRRISSQKGIDAVVPLTRAP